MSQSEEHPYTLDKQQDSKQRTAVQNESMLSQPTQNGSMIKSNEPQDTNNVVYYCFLFYGFCILLPWSAILNSFDFLMIEMPGYTPQSTYPFANMSFTVFIQVQILMVGDALTWTQRLTIAFLGSAILMEAIPFLACLPLGWNYWVCFCALFPFGAFCGLAQGTVFTMAASMPFKYMGAVMFGNGIAAIFCNVLRAITLVTLPYDPSDPSTDQNAFLGCVIFISICALCLLSCVIVQLFVLKSNPFYIYHLDWQATTKQPNEYKPNSLDASDLTAQAEDQLIGVSFVAPISIARPPTKETWSNFFQVAKRNFRTTNGLLYALMFVFVLTFTVFPAVSFDAKLNMLSSLGNSEGWFVLLMNTIFSVFDTVGRKMGGSKYFDLGVFGVKFLSFIRIVFVATFYLIAFQVGPSWMFISDWFIILNMIMFAFTNGYVSTLCCCKGPAQVEDEFKGQVGAFLGTTLTFGILIGSIIAISTTPILKMTPGISN